LRATGGFCGRDVGTSSRRAAAAALGGGVTVELGDLKAKRIGEWRQNANQAVATTH